MTDDPLVGVEDGVHLIAFGARWCGAWSLLQKALDEIAEGGVDVRRIDVDEHSRLADTRAVVSVPTFVLMRGGKEVSRKIGAVSPQELKGMVA